MPDLDELLLESEERMTNSLEALKRELAKARTGRANPKMFDGLTVSYYGVDTPINQVSGISIPEANQIYIKPYDKSLVSLIEKAIFAANLGVTPSNDGIGVRIVLPPMTEENRRNTVKDVKKQAEEAKVAIRNIRRDLTADIKQMKKDSLASEDEEEIYLEEAQKLTDKYIDLIDKAAEAKEKEIMTI